MEEKKGNDGRLPSLSIEADNLAEAWHRAMIACYGRGVRATDPSYQDKIFQSFDADINIHVRNPLEEPMRHHLGMIATDLGVVQYQLEMTHGIHDHWIKDPNDPKDTRWSYTYHKRFASQIPFLLARINQDWKKKKDLSSRKYRFGIWRPKEDSILEQADPPCFQGGHLRFLKDDNGEWWLNYATEWRSRDLVKAWLENNAGQTRLMKLLADKTSDMLGIPIHIGSYIDKNTSLHIYGRYFEKEGADKVIQMLKETDYRQFARPMITDDESHLKGILSAQMHAETIDYGKGLDENALTDLGYHLERFPYPAEWDTWPKDWDKPVDEAKLK